MTPDKGNIQHGMSDSLSGMLLVATPALRDPNFRRTILFVAEHSTEDGAVAYVLNRPAGFVMNVPGPDHPLLVAAYHGGPVSPQTVMLASLRWLLPSGVVAFHTIGEGAIPAESLEGLRAFLGYAGWSPGQLEHELSQNAWLVLRPSRDLIGMNLGTEEWTAVMRQAGPVMRLLASAPDDPSLN